MLKWIGTIAGIIGSLLVASNSGFQAGGYIAFLLGSISWLVVSVKTSDYAGVLQWAFFSCVNAWGIINYL